MNFFTGTLSIIVILAGMLSADLALAQCTKDVDCKGDRICEDGYCTEPDEQAASIAPGATSNPDQTVNEAAPNPSPQGQIQPDPTPAPPPTSAPVSSDNTRFAELRSKRRGGRALLGTGIPAFVLGAAMQGGWALEDCWSVGTYGLDYQEKCELTSGGKALVISGFVLLTYGLIAIITGPVLIGKAKRGLRELASWNISPHIVFGGRSSLIGLNVGF